MPEAISKPNLVALPITSQELGRGILPPAKIGLSNSPTTIGLNRNSSPIIVSEHRRSSPMLQGKDQR